MVHEWFDWFTTGSRLVLFGSPVVRLVHFGSPVVQVVHDWFAWFTGGSSGSRSSGVVDVVRAHNLMGSVESQPAESRGEWSVSMFIQC